MIRVQPYRAAMIFGKLLRVDPKIGKKAITREFSARVRGFFDAVEGGSLPLPLNHVIVSGGEGEGLAGLSFLESLIAGSSRSKLWDDVVRGCSTGQNTKENFGVSIDQLEERFSKQDDEVRKGWKELWLVSSDYHVERMRLNRIYGPSDEQIAFMESKGWCVETLSIPFMTLFEDPFDIWMAKVYVANDALTVLHSEIKRRLLPHVREGIRFEPGNKISKVVTPLFYLPRFMRALEELRCLSEHTFSWAPTEDREEKRASLVKGLDKNLTILGDVCNACREGTLTIAQFQHLQGGGRDLELPKVAKDYMCIGNIGDAFDPDRVDPS